MSKNWKATMWKVLKKNGNTGAPYKALPKEEIGSPEWDPNPVHEGTRENSLKWIQDNSGTKNAKDSPSTPQPRPKPRR
jgi:hypothetical protein